VPDPASSGGHRSGGISPLFAGRPGLPVVVTTRNPLSIRASLGFAAAIAWALLASGVLTLAVWIPLAVTR
jgi:hypothetical protein